MPLKEVDLIRPVPLFKEGEKKSPRLLLPLPKKSKPRFPLPIQQKQPLIPPLMPPQPLLMLPQPLMFRNL